MLSAGCFCAPPEYNPAARSMLFSVFQSASSFFWKYYTTQTQKDANSFADSRAKSVRARFASAVYAFSL